MENLKSIVLLIDADNTRLAKLGAVIREVSRRGRVVVKRAYGNWKKDTLKYWEAELKRLAVKAEQQFDYATHKNATDIALVVDAMQLLHKSIYDAFVIVSSDSDFTPLAIALRESGAYVMGVGEVQTPVSFRYSCDEFIYLENIGEGEESDSQPDSLTAAEEKIKQKKIAAAKKAEAKKQAAKEAAEKKEAELRKFFAIHFKKQIYKDKKEEIIRAVLTSKTKQQVNNNLMKHFDGKELSTIYRKFEPYVKELPGH